MTNSNIVYIYVQMFCIDTVTYFNTHFYLFVLYQVITLSAKVSAIYL